MEFFDGDEAFRLQSRIDDHVVVVDTHHLGGDDLALAHFLSLERLFEQVGKTFGSSQNDFQIKHAEQPSPRRSAEKPVTTAPGARSETSQRTRITATQRS